MKLVQVLGAWLVYSSRVMLPFEKKKGWVVRILVRCFSG